MIRDTLLALDRGALGRLLREGHPIDPEALAGATYHGVPLALPRWLQAVTWKRFMKVFWRDDAQSPVRGWNVRTRPGPLDEEDWEPYRRRGRPLSFGHFEVLPADPTRPLLGCGAGVVLDYGWQGQRRFAPMGRVLDPLVALEPDGVDLLLGCSVLDLGLARLGTPTFFCLQRAGHPRDIVSAPVSRLTRT